MAIVLLRKMYCHTTIEDDKPDGRDEEDYYLIRVRTDTNHLGTKTNPLYIIPGMIATVDIMTGRKSVLDYLLKPILKAKQTALRERWFGLLIHVARIIPLDKQGVNFWFGDGIIAQENVRPYPLLNGYGLDGIE